MTAKMKADWRSITWAVVRPFCCRKRTKIGVTKLMLPKMRKR